MIIVILIILLALMYITRDETQEFMITRSSVCNSTDGRCYKVVDQFANKDKASEKLAYINKFGINLMRYMRDKYTWLGPSKHSAMIKRLFNNYNPDNIIENAPATDQYTSYVEDKGVVYALCLREKVSGKNEFHDYNILEFVAMHEMAHMASVTAQHDDIEFWINFKILVTNAVEAGLHTPVDYSKEPVNYCRLIVDYNPYFDNTIPSEN